VADERWQVTGSAAEVYERELVPAISGPEAGATMRAPFALGDEAALRDLVEAPASAASGWTGRPGRCGSGRSASW
jgi:hypothetical protein